MWSLIISLSILLIPPPEWQQETSFRRLKSEEVPAEVIESFTNKYGSLEVVTWELHTSTGYPERYVAIFDHEGLRHRARFSSGGEGLSVSTYYLFNRLRMLPAGIIHTCERDFGGHRIGSGEKITSLKSNKTIYRVRLRKDAELIVIYLDPGGELLEPATLEQEFQSLEKNN